MNGFVKEEERISADRRNSILGKIGGTPLLRLKNSAAAKTRTGVEIYAKAEWFNPSGSVKDRPALNMIQEAEKSGALTKGKTIIDATSGNTGIAYAMIGAVLGYRVRVVLPANAGPERKQILAAYRADVILTDPLEGTDGAQRRVKEVVRENPEAYFTPDQYNNPANWQAHYFTTAPEIYSQTNGRISHFVAGLGTTGTFVGICQRLKQFNPSIQCISFQPDSPLHGLEGLKHLPTASVPGIYDDTLADENLHVSTDRAYQLMRRLATEEGLLVGPSSAAALCATLDVAEQLTEGVIVTVFPDDGTKYLSHRYWE
ncbi:MAG: cysteine synthase family protein [Ignavibacteriales bacterium]|nr:cysteine synthase family protein [Ignavibacteriales bacterium]